MTSALSLQIGLGLTSIWPGTGGGGSPPASAITALAVQGPAVLPDGADAANPNGWVAAVTIPDDGVSTFDPTKIVLTVSDPGFTSTGAATTATRAIRGGAIVRKQYPNQAQRLNSAAAGTRTIYFSLTDRIYAGSTITAATAQAGYYGSASAGSIAGVANNSTLAYKKPSLAWSNKQHERATGASFAVEAYVAHRHPVNGQMVACVQFTASDAQATPNVSAVQTCGTPALSAFCAGLLKPEVFKASIPLAALTQGDLCQVNAKVYPWIGDASAVLDLSVDGLAWPTPRPLTKLRFLNDKTGGYGGLQAWVKVGASGGAVGSSGTPFPTIAAALTALATANGARGHADHSGSTIFLMETSAGAGADHDTGSTSTAAGQCWTDIRKDPAATGPVRAIQSGVNGVADKLCWQVPIYSTGFTAMDGGGGTTKMAAFENLTLDQAGSLQINYELPLCYWRGVTVASGPCPWSNFGGTYTASALVLGCAMKVAGNTTDAKPYAFIGNDCEHVSLSEFPTAQASAVTHDNAVIANNRMLKLDAGSALCDQRPVTQITIVQNLFERAGSTAAVETLKIGGDAATQPIGDLIYMHNTVPGSDTAGRSNIGYADVAGDVGIEKHLTSRFNLLWEFNSKTDTFTNNTTVTGRTGNWRGRYGVGGLGDVYIHGDTNAQTAVDPSGANWIGEYREPGTKTGAASVGFVNAQAGAALAGGGDYRLTGPANDAYARVPAGMGALKFDLFGNTRLTDGSEAAGACSRTA